MRVFALAYKKATTTIPTTTTTTRNATAECTAAAFKTPNTHTHIETGTHTCMCGLAHTYPFTVVRVVKRVQVGKNKTFSQLIALNLKCCKINSRVMPNTQAQSFMQTETANVERETERESDRERERGRDGAEKSCTLAETETGHGTAELLLKRAGKCTVEKRTKRETKRKGKRGNGSTRI